MSDAVSNEPIIIARDVQKWYGHFQALRGVNMEVKKGRLSSFLVHQVRENPLLFAVSTISKIIKRGRLSWMGLN